MSGIAWAVLLCKRGDTFRQTITVTDTTSAGVTTPTNLTGCALVCHIRERDGSSDVLEVGLVITGPLVGEATLTITKEQTAALASGTRYEYEVEMTDGAGDISTPVEGALTVLPDRG